jgi:hypothetical protein
MIPHADVPCGITVLDGLLVQEIEVKQAPVSQVFHQRKMACVTHVVTNVKLIEVHISRFLNHPLKELPAGEGLTLFGTLMTSYLAGFHNIKTILLCKPK